MLSFINPSSNVSFSIIIVNFHNKPSIHGQSLYSVTDPFHHSVELIWLVSVDMVRRSIYQLHSGRDKEKIKNQRPFSFIVSMKGPQRAVLVLTALGVGTKFSLLVDYVLAFALRGAFIYIPPLK